MLLCVIFRQSRMLQMLLLPLCYLVFRVELLDEVQVRAINIANGKSLSEVPTVLFEFIGTEAYAREQAHIVQKIVSEHNGSVLYLQKILTQRRGFGKLGRRLCGLALLWSPILRQ